MHEYTITGKSRQGAVRTDAKGEDRLQGTHTAGARHTPARGGAAHLRGRPTQLTRPECEKTTPGASGT